LNRTLRTLVIYGLSIIMLAILAQWWFDQVSGPEDVPLSQFLESVDNGEFEQVQVLARSNEIQGSFNTAQAEEGVWDQISSYPEGFEGDLILQIQASGIPFNADPQPPSFWEVLVSFLPWLFLLGFMVFIFMQMQGGGNRVMQFGKSRAKLVGKEQPKVTFDDVAGLTEAKEELEEIKDFLQNPDRYRQMGAKIPRGVLLFGPPGTGKTLLAKAVAGEAGVPFMSISGSDFVEMFVGVGASRVRDLFEQAKASAPAIVFIDEIDAVGRHRGAGLGGGHDEREQTLNQLLVELDGFEGNLGVIVMAATNRPDILDPALLRPGRFDRQVVVDHPDIRGRTAILEVHARGKPLAKDVDLEALAQQTPGFTGADLANLINEAALLAARGRRKEISMAELTEAIDRVIAGPERKSKVMSEEEKKVTAYHEAGHALVGYALPHSDPIHKVTIIPRGRAGGYTRSLPTEDRSYHRRSEMVDRLAMGLGGRTAEEIIFNDPSTGAGNDIEVATQLARQMVMVYGMSDKLGPMAYGRPGGEVFLGRDYNRQQDYSDEVAAWIDQEVRRLLEAAHEEARLIITTHMEALERLVAVLLEKETVDRDEVADIFYDVPKWEHTEEGSLRIRYPENPVLPQPREDVAAAETSDEGSDDNEPVTESLTLERKLRRRNRPADAGA
jgi:cell division protease FtsH